MSIGLPKGMTRDDAYVQGLSDAEELRMKVWDITLTCDHKLLVIAATAEAALVLATEYAKAHDVEPETLPGHEPEEISLDHEGLLAWYPGPFSKDAISDESRA